jgi:hypothetical protein
MATVKNIIARIIIYLPEAALGAVVNILWIFTLGLYKFNFEMNWMMFINRRLINNGWLSHWLYRPEKGEE